jgi:hypothetical protein
MIPFFKNLINAKIESWSKVAASWALRAVPALLFGLPLNCFDA